MEAKGSLGAFDRPSTDSGDLLRVTATVSAAQSNAALAFASDLLETGCQERHLHDGRVALDFWTTESNLPDQMAEHLRSAGIEVEIETVADVTDWQASLRRHHRPILVGPLYVRPPWEEPRPGALDVLIDPGMAFGTGQHPTTRGCLELLLTRPTGTVLDAGCGSGVLAIAARRLGHDPVWAVDDDPDSVRITIENASINGVGLVVGKRRIGEDRLPAVDGVVANLTASMMGPFASALREAPPRWAILSGIRGFETEETCRLFASLGLTEKTRIDDDPWVALLLTR